MLIGPVPITQLVPHPGVTGLAIGVFDGVHLGHQAVVRSLTGRVAALTFEPHPLAVIAPERVPARLTTLEQKVAYMRAQGTVAIVAVKFDELLRNLSPAEFVDQIARIFPDLRTSPSARAGPSAATAPATPTPRRPGRQARLRRQGHRARRARRRAGQQHAHPRGHRAAPLCRRRAAARPLLRRRRARRARRPARPHHRLPHRQPRRDRAAPAPRAEFTPCCARIAGHLSHYNAVMNLGQRPTFTSNGVDSLEVHLLDFNADLYGQKLWVSDFHCCATSRPSPASTRSRRRSPRTPRAPGDVIANRPGHRSDALPAPDDISIRKRHASVMSKPISDMFEYPINFKIEFVNKVKEIRCLDPRAE
ncbi:MAG: riboflavin kinase [Verrucomicrobiota bacterium]